MIKNLLNHQFGKNHPHLKKKNKHLLKVMILSPLFVVIVIFFLALGINYGNIAKISSSVRLINLIKENIQDAKYYAYNRNFNNFHLSLSQAENNLKILNNRLDTIKFVWFSDYFNKKIKPINDSLKSGERVLNNFKRFVALYEESLNIYQEKRNITYSAFTEEEKQVFLKNLYESAPIIRGLKANLQLEKDYLTEKFRVSDSNLIAGKIYSEIYASIDQLVLAMEKVLPAAEVIPAIFGYPAEKTYLLALQNNNELRPTGGFIGTYGIIKLNNGSVKTFWTDNIYNIDDPYTGILNVLPPDPIKKYFNQSEWLMRDSNWDPDFTKSAKQIEWFYYQQGGEEEYLDGVIALTPAFIGSIIDIIGYVEVDGIRFDSENISSLLQYEVQEKYNLKGISEPQRKQIISDLGSHLIDRLYEFSYDQIKILYDKITQNIEEKNVIAYFKDYYLQNMAEENGWAGKIEQTDGDYLLIVDCNIGSLKTDAWMNRIIKYSVNEINGGLIANLEIKYHNQRNEGEPLITDYATRYRTYTRVYVPEDSELISYDGIMANDRDDSDEIPRLDIYKENGKTVFGAFIYIEPKEERSLKYSYKLPNKIYDQLDKLSYSLIVQKQPGTSDSQLDILLDLPYTINSISPLTGKINGNRAVINTDLRRDRKIDVNI